MFRITGHMRDYAWGSAHGIPEVLGYDPDGTPVAEYWLGAHHSAPSQIACDAPPQLAGKNLEHALCVHPELLGEDSRACFGERLPFLLKLLSARTALSIQAHPSREQALAGFAREELTGPPLGSPQRNYQDEWHKPELIYALSEFDALCGFRTPAAIIATFERFNEHLDAAEVQLLKRIVLPLRAHGEDGLKQVVDMVLSNPEYRCLADRMAAANVPEVPASHPSHAGSAVDPVHTLERVQADFPSDAGALVALMLGMIRLQPGQALAMEDGVLHAYLGGFAVEIMASSDNVLRGGLTKKHIDVVELSRVVKYRSETPRLVTPTDGVFAGPAPDFALRVFSSGRRQRTEHEGAAIALCLAGTFDLLAPDKTLQLTGGQAAFIPAGELPEVSGDGKLVIASAGSLAGARRSAHSAAASVSPPPGRAARAVSMS